MGESLAKMEAEVGVIQTRKHQEPPEPGRRKKGFSSKAFAWSVTLLTP